MKRSMKTRNYALILFAGVSLLVTSCVNEREFGIGEIGKDEIAFAIGSVQTKASTEDFFISSPKQVASVKASAGNTLIIEESVTSLDGGPVTKGTPAFTENVSTLYKKFSAIANPGTADELGDAEYAFNEATEFWSHKFTSEVWENAPFTFYMRMPSAPAGVTSGYTYDGNTIKFSYKSPGTAAGQQDILFASTTMNGEAENGKTVTFYHALTGIKFSSFYTNKPLKDGDAVVKTIIKEVTISGLKDTGTCTMDLSKSRSCDVADWGTPTGNATFTLEPSDTTDYTGSKYGLDTLMNSTARARNLNDKDGTLTFWVIPQAFEEKDSVKISVTCDLVLVDDKGASTKTVSDTTLTVSLGAREWKAGELHTFTLKPVVVGVEIDDDMDEYVKSDVVVENTGNVWQYVRVNLVANWWGNLWKEDDAQGNPVYYADSTILSGYAHATGDEETLGWEDKDLPDGEEVYGDFVNLVAKSTTTNPVVNSHGWVRFDKYWYYTKPIGPGDAVSDTFFDSYTVGPSPEFWIADVLGNRHAAGNVHLIMDLMVQSIEAPLDKDGNETSDYMHAWAAALGYGDDVSALDDL